MSEDVNLTRERSIYFMKFLVDLFPDSEVRNCEMIEMYQTRRGVKMEFWVVKPFSLN